MQLATLATIFATLGAGLAQNDCFSTGANYSPWTDRAKYHTERSCMGYSSNGQWVKGKMQGHYGENEVKKSCVDLAAGKSIKFEIRNKNGARDGPDGVDCKEIFVALIVNCSKGGERDISGWRYRIDPNNSAC